MSSIVFKARAIVNFLNDPKNRIDDAEAFLCDGQFHAWQVLKNRPGTPKIAVGFDKAQARSTFPGGDITGRANQYFYAIISRGRGLSENRADNVYDGVEGGKPLAEDAETLLQVLRTICFDPVTDEPTDWVSIESWGQPQGFNIDGFKVTIWIGSQMTNFKPINTNNTIE